MEATAYEYSNESATDVRRTPLAILVDHAEAKTNTRPSQPNDEDSRTWRAAALGAAIGCVIVMAAITTAGILGGIAPGSALSLGAFVGLWGGMGFGFMMGAMISLVRHPDPNS